jgi:hypothetical protein
MSLAHPTRRRLALGLAALALLLAQAVGLAHRVAHADAAAPHHHAALHGDMHAADHGVHPHGEGVGDCEGEGEGEHAHAHAHAAAPWSQALAAAFDAHHDEGSVECRLVDQLGHGDAAPCGSAGAVAFDTPAFTAPTWRGTLAARPHARPYCARAPPTFLA